MSRPRLLDLYAGAGRAAVGYHRAGFEVVGVDIAAQKHYPFEFHQAHALEYAAAHGREFDAIHASPPCQAYSVTRAIRGRDYPELIGPTRAVLIAAGVPYVIENVPGAPLIAPILLCGEMFGLRVIRHRLFETSTFWLTPPHLPHRGGTNSHRGFSRGGVYVTVGGHNFIRADGSAAMGIDWMIRDELAQAIPPAYTEWIGVQLRQSLRHLGEESANATKGRNHSMQNRGLRSPGQEP